MNGDGAFNGHILVDKLSKLNSSQQSIETLSHWCIFHRKNARQVVETWERQFRFSPRDQRVSFLYLANDILQNSRRKGMEFVGEFWKVLPDALNDVIENGDESGRKAALRLVDIWEERKVFSPRGQTLKEEFLGRNRRSISYKLKQPGGDMLEKLIASYQHAVDGYDEDALFGKCRTAICSVEKVEKDIGSDFNLGNITESGIADELQVQHGLLRECIQQLKDAESSRMDLVSNLREALHEQESKVEQLRNQIQVAQARFEGVERILSGQAPSAPQPDQDLSEIPPPPPASAYCEPPLPPDSPTSTVQTTVAYIMQQPHGSHSDISSHHVANEEHQITAGDVLTNHTASAPSSQMHGYVFPPVASEGVIGQSRSEDYPSDLNKRPRLDNGAFESIPCYLPQPQPQPQPQPPPPPTFPHPDSVFPPPPPPLPHALPPLPPPPPPPPSQFGQTAPFSFGSPPMPHMPGYPVVGIPPFPAPPVPYQFQGSDGAFFGPPPYPPPGPPPGPPPPSRQQQS